MSDLRQILAFGSNAAFAVVHLDRAVAIAMRDGPEAGLAHIEAVLEHGGLANY